MELLRSSVLKDFDEVCIGTKIGCDSMHQIDSNIIIFCRIFNRMGYIFSSNLHGHLFVTILLITFCR